MMVTWRYEAVKFPVKKSFTCTVCGRRGQRSKTFRQTINPFNKNADGVPKTYREIWAELEVVAAGWFPTVHAGCE
jgi:hypothetical protein